MVKTINARCTALSLVKSLTTLAIRDGCGLHELIIADNASKKLIQERARGAELFASAVNSGMRKLKMDVMEKILMGLTDLKMVRSVCIK